MAQKKSLEVDGNSLTLADVILTAKNETEISISPTVKDQMIRSVNILKECLAAKQEVYGVTTGFGGSADTRTRNVNELQHSLLQTLNCGILARGDLASPSMAKEENDDQSMPSSWVRGAILIRMNSLVRGHSAIRYEIIEALSALLQNMIIPVVPLRGSISASGDLMPLSYVAGALEGNPNIYVRMGLNEHLRVIPSDEALALIHQPRIILQAKEGLGLINGTAMSASVASLAICEANQIASLTQMLTAMATEALRGRKESFHPFIAAVRPHQGQIEAAQNIFGFLSDSKLAKNWKPVHTNDMEKIDVPVAPEVVLQHGLVQDRYSIRTATQWIGPQLEDLRLAQTQVEIELNSTTDNPLFDPSSSLAHSFNGGNFQAASLTSAMEKTRGALQMLGKLMFAQSSEIINPMLNNGLPANLAADEPSLSFTCKGIDISMAAYMSELAYLANPVSTHVQSAEMHNQAVNSLALISARKTMEAIDIVSMMIASFLFTLCQAVDLRVMQHEFFTMAHAKLYIINAKLLRRECPTRVNGQEKLYQQQQQQLSESLWASITHSWFSTGTSDLRERCEMAVAATAPVLLRLLIDNLSSSSVANEPVVDIACALTKWQDEVRTMLEETYDSVRTAFFTEHAQRTPPYLGSGSAKLYGFVRETLAIKMHRGLADAPGPLTAATNGTGGGGAADEKKTIGSLISIIYAALRDDRLYRAVL